MRDWKPTSSPEVLDLVFEPDGQGGIHLRLSSAHREARAAFVPPFQRGELEDLLNQLPTAGRHLHAADPLSTQGAAELTAEEIGLHLFRSLAVGNVARPLFNALERAWVNDEPSLLLRLAVDPAEPEMAAVAALPWELLYDPNHGFLARSLSISVARFVPIPRVASPLRSGYFPLRILLASAAPRDTEPLDLERELQGIRSAVEHLRSRRVRVDFTVARDPRRLSRELRQGRYHVLHFFGHGALDPATGSGRLFFGGPEEPSYPVSGRVLASNLEDLRELRLVVINACNTARFDRRKGLDPYTGVAHALVRAGLPAVVAMQLPISDEAAIAFSGALYEALADREPVDLAVAQGRRAIRSGTSRSEDIEWAAPTLFLQVPSGRILDLRPPPREIRKELLTVLGVLLLLTALWGGWELFDPGFPYRAWLNRPECPSPEALGRDAAMRFVLLPRPSEGNLCVGKFEVTQKQWDRVMGAETDDSPITGPDHPVTKLSLQDAQDFVDTLNRLEGEPVYRLPTETEWEWLARAGTTTTYSFGDDPAALADYGNCLSVDSEGDGADRPAPVGSYLPNPWGLYDVHGNVFEWVVQPWPITFEVEELGKRKEIRRGGGFNSQPSNCTSTARDPHDPKRNESNTGVRIVRQPVALPDPPEP